jgi:hypothetical protein
MTPRNALLSGVTIVAGVASANACAYYEDRNLPVAQPEQVTAIVSSTLHGDDRCAEHTRLAVGAAMGTYAEVTDGRAQLRITWDLTDSTLMTFASAPVLLCTDLPPRWGDHVDGDIVRLAIGVCPDEYACALHALGHYLGLRHVPAHGVMAAHNPARSFSTLDLAELHRVGLYQPRRQNATTVTVTVDPMPRPSLEIPP